ncbi:hypothetical protein [Pseudomonas chlororaphis]|uniref:hypothetical protein n=1 Tax=Pseudomonas chlororaphis TaxID=587753 RepID=UPI0023658D14|nr:hypothetical protein [Pseudomonas chlororaphis]WDG53960.1 hypothetical protein PUP76_29530 [Pseudomonas chlororaphis]WDH90642.1 hypothetical protein PUP74_11665 [Pseudomonas chlororaphis]
MSLFGKHATVLVLAALAGFSALEVSAAQPTNNKAKVETVSMLGGKFKFSLPKGFIANPLPAGDEASGTAGATGTLYTNASTKTVVIAAENLIPDAVQAKDNDAQFLDSAVSGFLSQQAAALPDFSKQSEKSMTRGGLGLRQIDSTATQGGGMTQSSTLLAGSGNRMAVVQVISRIGDKANHDKLVSQIVGK